MKRWFKIPYGTTKELPQHIHKYPVKVQRQFIHVFNSVFSKAIKEGKTKKEADTRAFMAANSVLKKNIKKNGYGHNISFRHSVDKFLGRLPG